MKLKYNYNTGNNAADIAVAVTGTEEFDWVKNAHYLIPVDIDLDGNECDAWLGASDTKVFTYDVYGGVFSSCELNKICRLEAKANIGCGHLEGELADGQKKVICRFSHKHIKRVSEFASAVNNMIETGEHTEQTEDEQEDEPICPKCGKPFMSGTRICPFCIDKISIIKKLLRISKPYNKTFVVSALLLLASNGLNVLVPAVNRRLIEVILYLRMTTLRRYFCWRGRCF